MNDKDELIPLVNLKTESEVQDTVIEVIPEFKRQDPSMDEDTRLKIEALDRQIANKRKQIDAEDVLIYNLTDHSDSIDRAVAASVGVLAAVLDLFLVDQMDIKTGRWTEAEATDFVNQYSSSKIVKDTNTEGLLKNVSNQMAGKDEGKMFPVGNDLAEKIIYGTINWFTSLVGTNTKMSGPMGSLLKSIDENKASVKLMSKSNLNEALAKETSKGTLNLTQGLTFVNLLLALSHLPVIVPYVIDIYSPFVLIVNIEVDSLYVYDVTPAS